jgi:aryl-alcohol dehydrogenase-like predicted oxidoreductase
MGMSWSYGGEPRQKKDMITLIRAAVDQGVTFFDTALIPGIDRSGKCRVNG